MKRISRPSQLPPRVFVCLLLLATLWIFGPSTLAIADEYLTDDMPLLADGEIRTILALDPMVLHAGEKRYLWSTVTMSGPDNINANFIFGCEIQCTGPVPLDPAGMWSTTNWRGHDQDPQGIKQKIHFLLVAPVDGTYYCMLAARSKRDSWLPPFPTMTVEAGENATYLKISDLNETMAEQWTTREPDYVEFPVGTTTYVLRKTFHASPSAEDVVIVSDLELTTCYRTKDGNGNCDVEADFDGTHVETRLLVAQLDAAGNPCTEWWSYPSSGVLSTFVDNDSHHKKVYHSLTVPRLDGAACSNNFAVKTLLHVVSGNPLHLDYDTSSMLYTSGIALNRGIPTGVGDGPNRSVLSISAYPNPFNPETTVYYTVPTEGHIRIEVFDARGALVRSLADHESEAGTFTLGWNGRDNAGNAVGSGIYFARLTSAGRTHSCKLTLIK